MSVDAIWEMEKCLLQECISLGIDVNVYSCFLDLNKVQRAYYDAYWSIFYLRVTLGG